MWAYHIKTMCRVTSLVTFDLEPQGQIIAFSMTSVCPGCNLFVLRDMLLILGMCVDHPKTMCCILWLVTFDLEFDLKLLFF